MEVKFEYITLIIVQNMDQRRLRLQILYFNFVVLKKMLRYLRGSSFHLQTKRTHKKLLQYR